MIRFVYIIYVLISANLCSSAVNVPQSKGHINNKGRNRGIIDRNLGSKGKGKSNKTQAPTLSSMPTSTPSSRPSAAPSTTSSPSKIPSSNPSFTPTSQPSRSPSQSPTTSSQPSSEPTADPTSKPTSTPSQRPSVSFQPTQMPSVSLAPSIHTISGQQLILDANGTEIVQNGCAVPPQASPVEFAEASIRQVVVEFIFLVRYKKDAASEQIIKDLDRELAQFVFDNFIECPTSEFKINDPIGTLSSPVDFISQDFICAEQRTDTSCLAIEASFTILYPTNAELVVLAAEEAVLRFLKDAMNMMNRFRRTLQITPEFTSSNPDVTQVVYVGKRNEISISQSGIISSATSQEYEKLGGNRLSTIGGILVGSAIVVVLGIFFVVKKKRTEMHNYHTSLRNKSGYAEYEADNRYRESNESLALNSTPASTPERELRFPMSLNGLDDAKYSSERYHTQNVHQCKSSTCLVCKTNQEPEFIRLKSWREDVEVEYCRASSSSLDFDFDPASRELHDEFSDRKYGTPNTVTL